MKGKQRIRVSEPNGEWETGREWVVLLCLCLMHLCWCVCIGLGSIMMIHICAFAAALAVTEPYVFPHLHSSPWMRTHETHFIFIFKKIYIFVLFFHFPHMHSLLFAVAPKWMSCTKQQILGTLELIRKTNEWQINLVPDQFIFPIPKYATIGFRCFGFVIPTAHETSMPAHSV